MNINSLKPASAIAEKLGAKSIVYGAPGTGKTPILNTAPRPVLCCVEPGMLSMRSSNVPTWEAYTPAATDEFFEWVLKSKEADAFDTIAVDSVSQMAEVFLTHELKTNKDGRMAYGEMSRKIMKHMNDLYFAKNKHCYLICKQAIEEVGTIKLLRPFFPGKDLNVKVPHLFDLILHLDKVNIPGYGVQKAFRTTSSFDVLARDRSGKLAEFEPPNLTDIFNKAMS